MKQLTWLICGLVMMTLAAPVAANGAPIKIFLNYLPEISNYGSTSASGEALVSIGEAWVDLKAEGLPQLSGQLYEAWLVVTETNEMISLGKFNANADGQVTYYAELEQIPDVAYRSFVISVEPDPDPSPAADARRTLAGLFPNPQLLIVSGTPTPTVVSGVTPTPGAPATLPVTGNGMGALDYGMCYSGFLAVGLGLVGIGWGLLKTRQMRLVKRDFASKSKMGDKL